jgi:hypothetical protein
MARRRIVPFLFVPFSDFIPQPGHDTPRPAGTVAGKLLHRMT